MGQLESYLPYVEPERVRALVRKDKLGDLSFERIVAPMATIHRLLLDAIPLEDEIPTPSLNQAISHLNALGTIDAQIDAFSVTDQNPLGMRDSLVQQVLSVRDGAVTQLRPFLRMESDEIAAQLRETQAALLSVNEERRALADLLSQARQGKVEEAGQDAYQFFEDEATAHDNTASKFLVYTVGFSLVLFAVALAFIVYVSVNPPSYANWGDAAAATVPKITLLLILSFAVGFAARNYRINRHLSVLNRTKAVTIRAAERYAAGVEEPAHRDLVVASLVQSVFSIGDTGYLPVDSERTIIESPGVASMIAASTPKAGS